MLTTTVTGANYEEDLLTAVREGNLEKAEELLEKGAEADRWIGISYPLTEAVIRNDLEMARLLIDAGANVNEYADEISGTSLFEFALNSGNDEMAQLLADRGVRRHILSEVYSKNLYSLLNRGKADTVEDLITRGIIEIDCSSINTLEQYTYGNGQVRTLLRKLCPDLSGGDINLLDRFLDDLTGLFTERPVEEWFPMATSYLDDDRTDFRYAPDKAFDGELETSWVEGTENSGLGEKIAFYIDPETSFLEIFPGYGVEKYFLPNNRLKRATLRVYYFYHASTAPRAGYSFSLKDTAFESTLLFRDEMEFHRFPVGLPDTGGWPPFVAVLEIDEVYKGTRWDDTCVAEIRQITTDN